MNDKLKNKAINQARGLAIDQIEQAKSGHPGMPLGAMGIVFELWANHMKFSPENPEWPNRDRFVLSAGHASAMLYSLAYLFGYDYSLDDLKQFRQWGSVTPGHPDYAANRGVEMTTGPLGQGIATAVGMAIGERHLAEKFNTDQFELFNHYTYVLVGDGCLMEGISAEASSLAGHLQLDKLIVLYDSNNITIDGRTDVSLTEDVGKRYQAYGWDYHLVEDVQDLESITQAIEAAKNEKTKPSLIEIKSKIGYGAPFEDTSEAHGSVLGPERIRATKIALGLDPEKDFQVDEDVLAYTRELKQEYSDQYMAWGRTVKEYSVAEPEKYDLLVKYLDNPRVDLTNDERLASVENDSASRESSGICLNIWGDNDPLLIGGSADLTGPNQSELKNSGWIKPGDYKGNNIHFGVREFAMGAIANGLTLMGLNGFCATFLVFTDYMKYSIRMASLMKIPTFFIMTHDSVGIGEDGETHQPIEHFAALRAQPNLDFWRPADSRETAAAYACASNQTKTPSLLALSRQGLPLIEGSSFEQAQKGGYIVEDINVENGKPDIIYLATGSEVKLAVEAATSLAAEDLSVRVVSMPCWEVFERQNEEYKTSVLPSDVKAKVSVEAASTFGWHKYVGDNGYSLGIDHFGASAPGNVLFEKYGFTVENLIDITKNYYNNYFVL